MSGLRVVAYAKVNLSLEVLGKRPDGYHELRSVMQSISLGDELQFEDAEELSLECNLPELSGEDNLVLRAVRMLQGSTPRRRAARIVLRKAIPPASGLGGASADAAATLVGITRLWGAKLPERETAAMAAALGSDVPFFLSGGTALVRGRGEEIDRLPDVARVWLVLLVPPHSLRGKTALLYRLLRADRWSSGERTLQLAESVAMGRGLQQSLLGNSFDAVADGVFGALPDFRKALEQAGGEPAHLSGAGPAIFSLYDEEGAAREAAARLVSADYHPLVAHTLTSAEARPAPLPFA